jgi:hypothetical protein
VGIETATLPSRGGSRRCRRCDLEVHFAQHIGQRVVEDGLELDAFAPVDFVDLLLDFGGREAQAGVHHGVDGGVHGVFLHAHEVGERVVEVEDDGFDHAILLLLE